MLNKLFFKKTSFRIMVTLGGSILGLYATDHLDDAYFLIGGVTRAIRCGLVGIKISYRYINSGINQESHEYSAKKLYECCRKNSGCYIKLGQVICQLEHIIPQAYVKELEKLCMECPTSEYSSIKKTLEREYKQPLDQIFSYIDPVPIGSASIAQVHKAVLLDGTKVAIKVQHANIPLQCPGDIITVKLACAAAEIIFPEFKYKWLGKEFQVNLPKEIDFNNEGRNADRIRNLLKDDDRVVIPRIFWNLSSKKILVMSLEEGRPITDKEYIKKNNIEIKEVAHILCDTFNRQIFELGFVHSDPHPGNLFVRKEKVNGVEKTKLVLLDHGLYRDLDDKFRYDYASLWRGIITQNKDLLRKSCNNLNINKVELFISLLTSNTYDSLMSKDNKYLANRRIGLKKTKEEKERLQKYAAIYHSEITHVLNDVRREMLLLLKINEFLRNIDRRMGNPTNNFEVMMRYIYTEIKFYERDLGYLNHFYIDLEYLKFKFFFSIFRVFISFKNFLHKSKEEKLDENDAEIVFEYLH